MKNKYKYTKIVCTLGPSSDSITEITNLVQAGMNVARLNFSHGSYEHHTKLINNIRKIEKITGKRIGILQDLQGPKIRLGILPEEGIKIKKNEIVILTANKISAKNTKDTNAHFVRIPIQYKNLVKDVKTNDLILIGDGMIEIKVLKIVKDKIFCKTKIPGILKSNQGINVPTASISRSTITAKDKKDLKFGLKHKVDFIALSFVKSAKDIHALRKLIEAYSNPPANIPIVAKIERHEAVTNLKEIIQTSDAVMVARGDLGVDIPPEQVPIVQKRIIALANKFAKPVITATEVLNSMVTSPRATRAEVSDAANAIFDHTDAIMLSNETSIGKYPAKATSTLSKVAAVVEQELQKYEELKLENFSQHSSQTCATCTNACEIASETNADFIVVVSETGYTARQIARCRHCIPIIVVTNKEKTARELTLVWGLNTIIVDKYLDKSENKIDRVIQLLKSKKIARKGKKIVIVCKTNKKENLISSIKL